MIRIYDTVNKVYLKKVYKTHSSANMALDRMNSNYGSYRYVVRF